MSNPVKEYTYSSGKFSFSILNRGCAITSICTPDREGVVRNVTLPYSKDDDILASTSYRGLTVGRFANRISGASFTLGGETYSFEPNDGPNFLHSGINGIWSRIWNIKHMSDGFLCSIKVTEQEDGFPGDADIRVRFSLSDDGVFRIHYSASCTKACPMNLTNHTYFNLTGDPSKDVLGHVVKANSSRIVDAGAGLIPNGRLLDVEGTAFDFREGKALGRDIEDKALDIAGGYDHCFIIDRLDDASRGFVQFVHVADPQTGRVLAGYTDLPAFHLYSGNFLDEKADGFARRHGFCLETEFYPDCVNRSEFPQCTVLPGELFESTTVYHFYTQEA